MKPLKTGASYDDLREVPDNGSAEIFDGELYATPRPALPHTRSHGARRRSRRPVRPPPPRARRLGDLFEPELHFGNDVLVPDLAGWRHRCRRCGGKLLGVASIEEPALIERILAHLDRQDYHEPTLSPFIARAPPQSLLL